MTSIKIIVEKHSDGYVAYPIGLRGIVVGQGDSFDEALQDVRSAVKSHIETFGREAFSEEDRASEVFVAEAAIAV